MSRNCSECGEAISEARLKARPSVTICVPCQEHEEMIQHNENLRQAARGGYVNLGHIHKRWMNKAERSTADWMTSPAEANHG